MHNSFISHKALQNVAEFKHLGTTVTNQNSTHKKINSQQNSKYACYYAVQNCFLVGYPKT
jgi:hypothetical protein